MADHGDHHGIFDGLQSMGILNALRTGDPRVDMVMALLFPFMIQQAIQWFRILKDWITRDWSIQAAYEERTINHLTHKDRYGDSYSDDDTQNTILLKAIQLYMHAKIKLDLPEAEVDLTSTKDMNSNVGGRYYYDDYDDNNNDDDGKTLVGALSKYRILQKPLPNKWHDLGVFGGKDAKNEKVKQLDQENNGEPYDDSDYCNNERCMVRLRIEKSEEVTGKGDSTKVETIFRFRAGNGKAIDAFIQEAYDWYMDELRKMEDNSRYLYELKAVAKFGRKDDGDSSGPRSYTRYKLSDEKTFVSFSTTIFVSILA